MLGRWNERLDIQSVGRNAGHKIVESPKRSIDSSILGTRAFFLRVKKCSPQLISNLLYKAKSLPCISHIKWALLNFEALGMLIFSIHNWMLGSLIWNLAGGLKRLSTVPFQMINIAPKSNLLDNLTSCLYKNKRDLHLRGPNCQYCLPHGSHCEASILMNQNLQDILRLLLQYIYNLTSLIHNYHNLIHAILIVWSYWSEIWK